MVIETVGGMPMRVFEPIFDLRSRKAVGYEVLYRGVEDREKFFSSCTEQQDLEIFLAHVEEIRRVRKDSFLYFVNIFGSTLLNYWDVIERESGDLRGCLVLEISEKRRVCSEEIKEISERLGFLLSLDDFGSGWSSIECAIRLRPHFVKVDIKRLAEVFPLVGKIVKTLKANLVVERVENDKDLLEVSRYKPALLQGRILGEILV
jgi:EAL domain-containing protein (putative c-di-GMP-specific phosphodiesterase class I)